MENGIIAIWQELEIPHRTARRRPSAADPGAGVDPTAGLAGQDGAPSDRREHSRRGTGLPAPGESIRPSRDYHAGIAQLTEPNGMRLHCAGR
jgi:hypothetical protein